MTAPMQQRRCSTRCSEKNERAPRRRAPTTANLAARIASYELAFKMQQHAPEAVDFAKETEETQDALRHRRARGPSDFGRKCLLARRLVERGVRFIQLYSGGAHNDDNWDAHGDLVKNHT